MNPPISVDYATLKASVRQGLTTEGREYWWPILSSIDDQKFAMREYPDVSGSAERLLAMSSSASPIASPTRNNSTDNKVLVTRPKLTSSQEIKYNLLLETLATAKSVGECKRDVNFLIFEVFQLMQTTTKMLFSITDHFHFHGPSSTCTTQFYRLYRSATYLGISSDHLRSDSAI